MFYYEYFLAEIFIYATKFMNDVFYSKACLKNKKFRVGKLMCVLF